MWSIFDLESWCVTSAKRARTRQETAMCDGDERLAEGHARTAEKWEAFTAIVQRLEAVDAGCAASKESVAREVSGAIKSYEQSHGKLAGHHTGSIAKRIAGQLGRRFAVLDKPSKLDAGEILEATNQAYGSMTPEQWSEENAERQQWGV